MRLGVIRPVRHEDGREEAAHLLGDPHGRGRRDLGGSDGSRHLGQIEGRAKGQGGAERDPEQAGARGVLAQQDDEGGAAAGHSQEAAEAIDGLGAVIFDVGEQGRGSPAGWIVGIEVVDLAGPAAGEILGQASATSGMVRDEEDLVHRAPGPARQRNMAATRSSETAAPGRV